MSCRAAGTTAAAEEEGTAQPQPFVVPNELGHAQVPNIPMPQPPPPPIPQPPRGMYGTKSARGRGRPRKTAKEDVLPEPLAHMPGGELPPGCLVVPMPPSKRARARALAQPPPPPLPPPHYERPQEPLVRMPAPPMPMPVLMPTQAQVPMPMSMPAPMPGRDQVPPPPPPPPPRAAVYKRLRGPRERGSTKQHDQSSPASAEQSPSPSPAAAAAAAAHTAGGYEVGPSPTHLVDQQPQKVVVAVPIDDNYYHSVKGTRRNVHARGRVVSVDIAVSAQRVQLERVRGRRDHALDESCVPAQHPHNLARVGVVDARARREREEVSVRRQGSHITTRLAARQQHEKCHRCAANLLSVLNTTGAVNSRPPPTFSSTHAPLCSFCCCWASLPLSGPPMPCVRVRACTPSVRPCALCFFSAAFPFSSPFQNFFARAMTSY